MNKWPPRLHLLALLVLTSALFLANLGGYDLWSPDEPRYAQVTREMIQARDFLAPRVNGLPYKEKPPLLFWAQAVLAIPFGDVTEIPARLPSALGGIITVFLTYFLADRLFGRRTAFLAALILATTHRFWWQTRFGQIDMLLTTCTTAAFLLFWLWHTERRSRYLVGFYLAIAAGVLAKGPPALLFPLLMSAVFFWKRKEERKGMHLLLGTAAVAVLVGIWLVPARMAVSGASPDGAGGSIASNLFRQTLGRFFLGVSHANPPWYYFLKLPVELLPWSLFLPWTIPWVWRRRRQGEEMRFLLSWVVPAVVFFSLCVGKRALYMLPLYPAFAALLAKSIVDLEETCRFRCRKWIRIAWGAGLIACSFVPWALLWTDRAEAWDNRIVLLSLCLFFCGLHAFWAAWRSGSRALGVYVAGHTAVLLMWVAVAGFPILNPYRSAKSFCEPLRALSRAAVTYDLYSLGFSREEYIYHAEHFHERIPGRALRVDGMEGMEVHQQAALQGGMTRALQKATGHVAIESLASVTDEDIARLREAIENEAALGPHGEAFRRAVERLLEELVRRMSGDTPGFIIAQECDWRWALALCPGARELTVLKEESVGKRGVLLVANESACNLF